MPHDRHATKGTTGCSSKKCMPWGSKNISTILIRARLSQSFYYPSDTDFSFREMYDFIKERCYAIYPGKVTDADTFRIGNIGEIYPEDIEKLCAVFKEYMEEK